VSTEPPIRGEHEFSGNGREHETPVDDIRAVGRYVREARDAAREARDAVIEARDAAKENLDTQLDVLWRVKAIDQKADTAIAYAKRRPPALMGWALVFVGGTGGLWFAIEVTEKLYRWLAALVSG